MLFMKMKSFSHFLKKMSLSPKAQKVSTLRTYKSLEMITIPEDVVVYESPGGKWWVKNDILYSLGKKDPPKLSQDEEAEEMKRFKEAVGDRKICMILDITYAKPADKNERDKAAVELERLVKAMAMVTTSPLGRMVANLFFGLKPPSYPVKMFSNVDDAEKWIRQYV
jgi:hypothetical protein